MPTRPKPKTCLRCSRPYMTRYRDQKYCSPACGHAAQTVLRTCPTCQLSFQRKRSDQVYCSYECYAKTREHKSHFRRIAQVRLFDESYVELEAYAHEHSLTIPEAIRELLDLGLETISAERPKSRAKAPTHQAKETTPCQ